MGYVPDGQILIPGRGRGPTQPIQWVPEALSLGVPLDDHGYCEAHHFPRGKVDVVWNLLLTSI
jgi:hypothetical protein